MDLISNFSEASFVYSVPNNVSEQKDLVVAAPWLNHNNKTEAGNVVRFDFKHVLSKIGFNVITNNDASNEVDVTIKNIRLRANLYNKGTVYLLAETPKVVPDPNSVITSYSLFDHNYPAYDEEDLNEDGALKGFICRNSTTSVPIYQNITFDPENYEEVSVPTTENTEALNNRFMMILPAATIGIAAAEAEQK